MNYYYYQELPCGSEAAWVQCAVGAADPKMERTYWGSLFMNLNPKNPEPKPELLIMNFMV